MAFFYRVRGYYDVTDYGAKGDGATDDTAAIQSAINAAQTAGGGVVWIPPATFKVTGTTHALIVTGDNVTIQGTGPGSVIAHGSTTGDTLFVQKDATGVLRNESVSVRDLQFKPSVTKTAGNEVNVFYAYNIRIEGIRFQDCFRAIQVGSTNSPSGDLYKFRPVFGFVRSIYGQRCCHAILLMNCTDWWFDGVSFWLTDGPYATTTASGITIDTNCQSCNFVNMDIVGDSPGVANTGAGLTIQDTLGGGFIGRTAYNQFTNCYFDSWGAGIVASNSEMFGFTNCWCAAPGGNGVTLASTTRGFMFNMHMCYTNGNHGFSLDGADHSISHSDVISNGLYGTGNGINVAATASGFRILGNRITNNAIYQVHGNQLYGITIASGADNFIVKDNDTRGNVTGGINNLTTVAASRIVADNL